MIKIALHAPLLGNGGIVSWSKRFINTFPDDKFKVIPVNSILTKKNNLKNRCIRAIVGIFEIFFSLNNLSRLYRKEKFDIMHSTTSCGNGLIRDYVIAKWAQSKSIKTILHCHYGNIPNVIKGGGVMSYLLKKTFTKYDQIWVLDNYTFEELKKFPDIQNRVRIVPNNIDVCNIDHITNKEYLNYVFIANLHRTKGIIELVKAFSKTHLNIYLHIAGPDPEGLIEILKNIAGNKWGNKIKYYGLLPNENVRDLLKTCDALILPTYFPGEAFPISILEAMSYGKLVISTPRAAIPDMLSYGNESKCGIIIPEKSADAILDSIQWISTHKDEADILCRNAYAKVLQCYNTPTVYDTIFRPNYLDLLN